MRTVRKGDPLVAVAYLRVSTDEQTLGLDAQRATVEAWASTQGVSVVAWCVDEGISGGAALEARPDLVRAIGLLREHRAGSLVVAKRDRLARDVIVAAMVERLAADAGASVLSVAGEGSDATDDPSSALLRRMVDAFAEYERAIISLRTRKALAVKRAKGQAIGGNPPWGYRTEGDRWVPDEREQRVLALVLQLRDKGATFASIVQTLTLAGFTTRNGRPFSRPGVFNLVRDARANMAA